MANCFSAKIGSLFSASFTQSSFRAGMAALALGLGASHAALAATVGSGNVVTAQREVKNFHAVEASGFGSVVLIQGDTEGLTVEGEDNLLPLVKTEVDAKGILHLDIQSKEPVRATKPLVYKVSFKTLDRIASSGSGNVNGQSLTLKDGELGVDLSGSGNVVLKSLAADGLKVTLQGSGSFTFAGNVDHQEIKLAGSGDYDGAELKTKSATVTLTGSGDCDVWATDKLKVDVSGSGDVSYYGKPNVEKKVTGSGSIEGLGAKGQ